MSINVALSLFICLFRIHLSLSVSRYFRLSVYLLSIYPYIYQCFVIFTICLYLPIHPSIYLSVSCYFCLPDYFLSISLSISVSLSLCLSPRQFVSTTTTTYIHAFTPQLSSIHTRARSSHYFTFCHITFPSPHFH